jgi:hypothetical protein
MKSHYGYPSRHLHLFVFAHLLRCFAGVSLRERSSIASSSKGFLLSFRSVEHLFEKRIYAVSTFKLDDCLASHKHRIIQPIFKVRH